MGGDAMKKESLEVRLRRHPALQARVEALLDMVEDESGQLERADDAEEFLINQFRSMGQELLQEWASNEQHQVERHWDDRPGVARKKKKESTGTPCSDA
jgi:hypothetical protein